MPNKMNTINNLQKHLTSRYQSFLTSPPNVGNSSVMEKSVENIRKRVGEVQGKPATDRIQDALTIAFTKGPKIAIQSHLRYICWGLTEIWGDTNRCILNEQKLFTITINEIQNLKSSEIPISAWRGLLTAYFGYDDKKYSESKNWLALRSMILIFIEEIKNKNKFKPKWVEIIEEHKNLLGNDPCERYSSSILEGNEQVLIPLREELKIPNRSWFWSQLFLSQVKIAIDKNDDDFLRILERLLQQIDNFKYASHDALIMMLERYQKSNMRNLPHIKLRESVISAWGSPHLERNTLWGFTTHEAKLMVKNWLVTKALEDFFNLLQADRAADERRLNFWLRYQQSIDYFHFALGPEVYSNKQVDYATFRKRFNDHICSLTSPGQRGNNAFILLIGNYVVVEFGLTGNACYIYEKNKIGLNFENTYPLDLNRLKSKRISICHLSHSSNWEYNFQQMLASLGIYPDNKLNKSSNIRQQTHSIESLISEFTTNTIKTTSSALNDNENIFIKEGLKIAHDYGLNTEDSRKKGGAFWIYLEKEQGLIADKLSKAGFKYFSGRGWWRK